MPEATDVLIERETATDLTRADGGELEGYAVTWDYDEDGLRFEPGAFQKTLQERGGKIPLLVKHARDGSSIFTTVGWIMRGEPDDHGLMVHAKLLDTDLAQQVRENAMKDGIKGLSINAKNMKGERGPDGVLVSKEAMLREVTLTNVGKDPGAVITAVRDEESEATTQDEEPADEATPDPEPDVDGETEPPDGTQDEEMEAMRDDLARETEITLMELET